MNKNIHQCNQCKNNFPEQEVYRIGIKQKEFFCQECAKSIKSCCMWCGKDLAQKKWKRQEGYEIKSEQGQLTETIDHDDHRKEKHHKYYLICEETREHGIRPNKSCPSRFNDWWVNKKNKKCQDRKNQGWKECAGKGIYHKDPKTGKVVFDLDCYKLVPPGQKYCGEDSCVYYTAVYKNEHSEARKRIADKWNQRNQEKYQKANNWWNSLSLSEKQAELKKEEEHLNNLGLQQQRCWIERLDKNSILFENGKLHYDNMDKIPPSFLDRFGYPGFQWESVWKNDGSRTDTFQAKAEIEKEISNKEVVLKQCQKNGNNEMVVKLKQQIQELKSQLSSNFSAENPTKNNLIVYSVIGFSLVTLVGLVLVLVKSKWKKYKIK